MCASLTASLSTPATTSRVGSGKRGQSAVFDGYMLWGTATVVDLLVLLPLESTQVTVSV
jgi:hypothetical protein